MTKDTLKYFIGIDPSLTKTGFAIIGIDADHMTTRQAYCLKSDFLGHTPSRISSMRMAAQNIVEKRYLNATCIGASIEGPSLGSVGRYDELGQVRGVFSVWLWEYCHVCTTQIPPKSLKKYAAKSGDAGKPEMISAARNLGWDIPDKEDDMADAAHLAEMAYAIKLQRGLRLTRKQLEVLHTLHKLEVTNDGP